MNRKKFFCFKQNNNNKISILEIFLFQYIQEFFEIHDLYIMGLYDLRIFLHAELYLFVSDATLLHRIGNSLAYVAALLVASFWKSKLLGRRFLLIRVFAKPRVFANSRLISTFSYVTW